jgi:hypothetical protein
MASNKINEYGAPISHAKIVDFDSLRVVRSDEYIWKSYCWNAHFELAWTTAYHVVDSENRLVEGGSWSGGNSRAGYVRFPRRKDAVAWLAGFRGDERPKNDSDDQYSEGAFARRDLRHNP